MKIIGITGGMGSGKSTVSQILRDLGAKVLDADKIAREVVKKGEKALLELVSFFGEDILSENGELDRKGLADRVFKDPEQLRSLNSITHKYIIDRMLTELDDIKHQRMAEVVVLDYPLPVKHGFLDVVDEVWVVVADPAIRIKRLAERKNISYEDARLRINAQMSDEDYLRLADRVFYNEGSLEDIEKEVVRQFLTLGTKVVL